MFEKKRSGVGRVFVCEGGVSGTVTLPVSFTDQAVEVGEGPLTVEVVVALAAVVSACRS